MSKLWVHYNMTVSNNIICTRSDEEFNKWMENIKGLITIFELVKKGDE